MSFGDELAGRAVLGEHEYERVKATHGVLERALERYRRTGRRVLSYWRAGRSWMFKLELAGRAQLGTER